MLEILKETPVNVLAVKATGEINKNDYDSVLMPALNAMAAKTEKLNLLMLLETDVTNFSIGAWWDDVKAGLKNITKWHRTAIVTDQNGVRTFTDIFSKVFPGEFKGFPLSQQDEAMAWVSSENV